MAQPTREFKREGARRSWLSKLITEKPYPKTTKPPLSESDSKRILEKADRIINEENAEGELEEMAPTI